MGRLLPVIALFTASVVASPPEEALSRGIQGEMASSSRATVNISISVLPQFHLTVPAHGSGLLLKSNTAELRYHLEVPPGSGTSEMEPLVLPTRSTTGSVPRAMDSSVIGSRGGNIIVLVVPD